MAKADTNRAKRGTKSLQSIADPDRYKSSMHVFCWGMSEFFLKRHFHRLFWPLVRGFHDSNCLQKKFARVTVQYSFTHMSICFTICWFVFSEKNLTVNCWFSFLILFASQIATPSKGHVLNTSGTYLSLPLATLRNLEKHNTKLQKASSLSNCAYVAVTTRYSRTTKKYRARCVHTTVQ